MGKFDDKSRDTQPTRQIKNVKTRKLMPENKAAEDLMYNRDQLKAMEGLDTMAPPQTIFDPQKLVAGLPADAVKDTPEKGSETVVYRARRRSDSASPPPSENKPSPTTAPDESSVKETDAPVVAWLVILEGAGRGRAIQMSFGLNKIGRNTDQEVSLNFGDMEISRERHAAIEYDPKDRSFYLSKGENLVYLNDKRVGLNSEHKIEMGDLIGIGKTVLRFVPFCDPDFDWSD